MQRTKAAVSVEVKRVIGALCRLLAAVGLDAVPAPEAFRRAKFGGRTEEDQFWHLLADLIQTSGIVSSQTGPQLTADYRKLVTAGLWQTGYHAAWMYRRSGGGEDGESFSSRDLLLALGWLLAAGTLEKLMTQRVQRLDKTLLSPVPVKSEFSCNVECDAATLRRLQWLVGRLRHQRRTLLSMIRVRTRALHDVFSVSESSSTPSSPGQRSAVIQEDCVRLQQLCELLEAFVSWKQVENVFWTWMDSVVDLVDTRAKSSSQPPNGSPALCHHGDGRLEKLEEMLMKLPTTQDVQRGQTGSDEDRGGDGPGSSPLPSLILSLPSFPSIPEVCRARLQVTRPARRPAEGPRGGASGASGGLHVGLEAPVELPASRAAELLLHAEAALLQRRARQRRANRAQLQETISCVDQLVLIPL